MARDEEKSYRVEALAKGLRLLSLFSHERNELKVKELSDLSKIPMPTTFRLVATLEEEGYLERTPSGSLRPGTSVLALGFAAVSGLDVVQTSEPTMRELSIATGETVNLGVLYLDKVLFVARIPRRDSLIAAGIKVGSTVPAVFSSMGKVMLADLSSFELHRVITETSFGGRWGPSAVKTMDALVDQMTKARSDGYLIQQEEAIPGLSSIAAPIRQADGSVAAAINIAVPSAEYNRDELINKLLNPVLAAAREISMRLGGSNFHYS